MDLTDRIRQQFEESVRLKQAAMHSVVPAIAAAIEALAGALGDGHKVLICGNGGSAADAQHMAAELVGRFERERPALPAIALTTDSSILTALSNDYAFEEVFSRQVSGLGAPGDLLIAISTSGNSASVLRAVAAAHEREMHVIALTGQGGGRIAALIGVGDHLLAVPHTRTARMQEVHLLIVHCLCDGVDALLLGADR
jgi:D-sedoheptulose 7-phosphate isomerase